MTREDMIADLERRLAEAEEAVLRDMTEENYHRFNDIRLELLALRQVEGTTVH